MNLPQLHYAWAPSGSGGSGFRFTAVTDGVPDALLHEAERLVAYEAPEPGGAVPQALSLSLLSDGSRLLARSSYTGGDGTGFHAHAVHLPQRAGSGPVRGALPITSWGSPQWASRTPPGGPPPPLGAVPLPGRHDPAALAGFVAAREAWLAPFFADVRRLVEEPGAPRIVLVEPDSAAVARWVMLACSVLPHQRGQWLTFTTYTARPGLAPQGLVGVLPGERTAAALATLEEGCRIYEPGRGTAAPGDGAGGDVFDVWASTAARIWLARRPELFAEVRLLPGGPYEAGPLAALALGAGIALDAAGRAAAAAWTAAHPDPAPDRLRVALADPDREAEALAGLLREAARQGTDTTGELPEVARRVAFALFGDPGRAYGEQTRAALDGLPVLRALVLDRLDALAAGDPAAGLALFARTGLRLGAAEAVPHLRMCAAAEAVLREAPDGAVALDALLRVCGVSPYAEPLVLRTAVRLVWGGRRPDPDEAGLVLATTGAAVHREAGTWELFAPSAPPADGPPKPAAPPQSAPATPAEAPDEQVPPRTGTRATPGIGPVIGPTPGGGAGVPVGGGGVVEVAGRLLGEGWGEGALRVLFEREDAALLAAYREAARGEAVRERLRSSPHYLADRFAVWSAHPQAGPLWREARTDLLEEVLRPVVRDLPPEHLAEAERELARLGRSRAEEFRAWLRPGPGARLRGLFRRRPAR
ncbi:GTPase-associated protein 1-related protein [Streptomyces lavendulae]|uniref:GTPase-associated protein 1-related protein n=1 Tax=Streptomyces lavendulae TaxID=1914 RepID=UPI00367E274E